MKIKRNKFNAIILKEFKKMLQENEELREITLGASPTDIANQNKAFKDELSFMVQNFENVIRETYVNLQDDMNRDPELLKFASQFPEFDGAWAGIGQFIDSLPAMVESVKGARVPGV